jgi:homoserine kinase type II
MSATLPDYPTTRLPDYDLAPPITIAPLAQAGVNNAVWLVRTGAGEFVWKELRHAAGTATALAYEHWLVEELARQSPPFAVPVPVRARDGGTFRVLPDDGLGVLLPRLPGSRSRGTTRQKSKHLARLRAR